MLTHVRRALRQPLVAASVLFAAILSATGAFGTFRIVLPLRLLYWALITFTAVAALVAADRLHGRFLKHAWARTVATIVVAAVPTTFVSGAAASLMLGAPVSLGRHLAFFPAALILNALLLALGRLTARRDVLVEVAAAAAPDDSVPPAIAAKLPPRLARSRLLLVEAQDHYLRVATSDGQALIHTRFADALAALERSDGARVHRSWWVARPAIASMKFADGRGELTLVDGTIVPVSRSYAARLKQLARRPKP